MPSDNDYALLALARNRAMGPQSGQPQPGETEAGRLPNLADVLKQSNTGGMGVQPPQVQQPRGQSPGGMTPPPPMPGMQAQVPSQAGNSPYNPPPPNQSANPSQPPPPGQDPRFGVPTQAVNAQASAPQPNTQAMTGMPQQSSGPRSQGPQAPGAPRSPMNPGMPAPNRGMGRF